MVRIQRLSGAPIPWVGAFCVLGAVLPESCLTVARLTPRLDSEQAYFVSTQDRRAPQPKKRRQIEGRGRLAIMTLVSLFIMSPMADFQAFSSLSISAR